MTKPILRQLILLSTLVIVTTIFGFVSMALAETESFEFDVTRSNNSSDIKTVHGASTPTHKDLDASCLKLNDTTSFESGDDSQNYCQDLKNLWLEEKPADNERIAPIEHDVNDVMDYKQDGSDSEKRMEEKYILQLRAVSSMQHLIDLLNDLR